MRAVTILLIFGPQDQVVSVVTTQENEDEKERKKGMEVGTDRLEGKVQKGRERKREKDIMRIEKQRNE